MTESTSKGKTCPICGNLIEIKRTPKRVTTSCGCINKCTGEHIISERFYSPGCCTRAFTDPDESFIEEHVRAVYDYIKFHWVWNEKYRHPDVDKHISEGRFSSTDYGERAEGTYDRSMEINITEYGITIDVGHEYCFDFDKDIVEDLIALLQKCVNTCKDREQTPLKTCPKCGKPIYIPNYESNPTGCVLKCEHCGAVAADFRGYCKKTDYSKCGDVLLIPDDTSNLMLMPKEGDE